MECVCVLHFFVLWGGRQEKRRGCCCVCFDVFLLLSECCGVAVRGARGARL